MNRHTIILTGVLFIAAGCDEATSPVPATEKPAAGATARPAKEKPNVPAYKPTYAIDVKKNDAGHTIVSCWAKVNTGGWKLTIDSGQVEEDMGVSTATLFATIEQPGPDEVVAQAFETVSADYDAGEKKVDVVSLSVRQMVRGVKSQWAPLYEPLERWPK